MTPQPGNGRQERSNSGKNAPVTTQDDELAAAARAETARVYGRTVPEHHNRQGDAR